MDLSIISLRETKSPEDIVNDIYQKQKVNPTFIKSRSITTTGQEISDIETNSNCAQQEFSMVQMKREQFFKSLCTQIHNILVLEKKLKLYSNNGENIDSDYKQPNLGQLIITKVLLVKEEISDAWECFSLANDEERKSCICPLPYFSSCSKISYMEPGQKGRKINANSKIFDERVESLNKKT
ncbi:hypothetical protein BpHYR1_006576 [Brachionus plicatilis]|uniref:Uncharacterized protein n=1 Tax=Brachionus plicatilis TaxID=10195 RepID=A0A3M7QVG1_BRAPC|nr:hypothetical protein BpHYR1_006576 [Brachionus plicatilis]